MSEDKNNIKELEVKLERLLDEGMSNVSNFLEKEGGLRRDKKKNTILIEDYFIRDDGSVEINSIFSERQFKFLINAWENRYPILVGVMYAFLMLLNLRFLWIFTKAIRLLDVSLLNLQAWSICSITLLSVLLWLWSTSYDYWNYYNRKFFGLYLMIGTLAMRFLTILYSIFYQMFIPLIAGMEVTELMTTNKIAGLGWLTTILPAGVITFFILYSILRGIHKEKNIKGIRAFKIKHHIELKPRSPYDYDVNVVRDLTNGKHITIPMHDRWMHGAVVGATGTAKTSSTLLPMIKDDLEKKAKNEDAQKKAIYNMVKEGKAYITQPFKDEEYNPKLLGSVILPVKGHEKEFEKIVQKYKSAGITVVAPDPSLTDDVCDLSVMKGFGYNRIDPIRRQDGTLKPGSKGLNPLYISPEIPEWSHRKEMVKRATLTADVMQIMFEMSGKSDPYFSSVNRIATTTLCMLVMLAHERVFPGEKPKISLVRDLISDFKKITNYMPALQTINKQNNGIYNPLISIIQKQFLGDDKETFEKHCNGLRTQFYSFLENPEIERILCADDTIDMDMMLEEGQITTINIELGDLGPVNSPCFGLFLTVSLINAILRRKGTEWTRVPHFWYVDELPVVVNPSMEACFTLFRKFRVGMTVCLQTLNQFDKTPFLSYLRGVILNSCGFHVVFGRTNIDDQDTYSALGGMVDKVIEQLGSSSTALSVDKPSMTRTERYTTQEVARASTDEIRNRDFQEVTLFMVKDGRPLPPKAGKVNFLRKIDKMSIKRYRLDWEKLYDSPFNKKAEINFAAAYETVDLPEKEPLPANYNTVGTLTVANRKAEVKPLQLEGTVEVENKASKSNADILKELDSMISQTAVTNQETESAHVPINEQPIEAEDRAPVIESSHSNVEGSNGDETEKAAQHKEFVEEDNNQINSLGNVNKLEDEDDEMLKFVQASMSSNDL